MILSSGGEAFKKLWELIPTVKDYWEYVGLANEIDNNRGDREITAFDEQFLLDCLNRYAQMKGFEPKENF